VGEPGAAVLFSPATLLPFFGTMVPTHEGGTTWIAGRQGFDRPRRPQDKRYYRSKAEKMSNAKREHPRPALGPPA